VFAPAVLTLLSLDDTMQAQHRGLVIVDVKMCTTTDLKAAENSGRHEVVIMVIV
jgi:hypothetical protein